MERKSVARLEMLGIIIIYIPDRNRTWRGKVWQDLEELGIMSTNIPEMDRIR